MAGGCSLDEDGGEVRDRAVSRGYRGGGAGDFSTANLKQPPAAFQLLNLRCRCDDEACICIQDILAVSRHGHPPRLTHECKHAALLAVPRTPAPTRTTELTDLTL